MLGGFSSVMIISIIVLAIILNGLIVKQNYDYNSLNKKLDDTQSNLQSQINLISEDITNTQENIKENQQELKLLKASSGEDFSGIYSDAVESVVIVSTNVGQGTGFFVDKEGYIVTNYHVIDGATNAGIYTSDGKGPFRVSLIGSDEILDVALLKVEGSFETLNIGDSDNVKVGQKVLAIGNPYGLVFSATSGSVSQINREGPNGINAYIQIDAAINPGNSGGPLLNDQGEVIGIVNYKISGDAEGLGFALESNTFKESVNEISQEKLNQTLIG